MTKTAARLVLCLILMVSVSAQSGSVEPPAREALERAEAVVREAYPNAFGDRGDAVQRVAEARKLRDAAKRSSKPENRFVLLREASRLAAEAGELSALLAAEDDLAAAFTVPTWARRADAIALLATKVPVQGAAEAIEAIGDLAKRALNAGEFAVSSRLAIATCELAARTRDKKLIARAAALRTELSGWADRKRVADERLSADPRDAMGHRELGMFHCIVGDDWDAGLEHLARGGAAIAEVAARDRGAPSEASDQWKLADQWLGIAKEVEGASRAAFAKRAATWYASAKPNLDPAEAALVDRRLGEIAQMLSDLDARIGVAPAKDARREHWGVGVRVYGWRTGTRPHKEGDCTLDGVVVFSDDTRIELRLRGSWLKGGKRLGGENIWVFKCTGFDPKTGKRTYVLDSQVDAQRRPTHASNFRGKVVIDGTTMKGEYRFDWTDASGQVHEHRDTDAPHLWELYVGERPTK